MAKDVADSVLVPLPLALRAHLVRLTEPGTELRQAPLPIHPALEEILVVLQESFRHGGVRRAVRPMHGLLLLWRHVAPAAERRLGASGRRPAWLQRTSGARLGGAGIPARRGPGVRIWDVHRRDHRVAVLVGPRLPLGTQHLPGSAHHLVHGRHPGNHQRLGRGSGRRAAGPHQHRGRLLGGRCLLLLPPPHHLFCQSVVLVVQKVDQVHGLGGRRRAALDGLPTAVHVPVS
mmetsp:Transcript_94039/g.223815  ORF Transcript_94039/g.223815 Transcript_94039/m.223815 type:complete len:232 (+) Transcript_94039:243-938(+)